MQNEPSAAEPIWCGACGAENASPRGACWLCGVALRETAGEGENFYAPPRPTAEDLAPSFSLSTLLLVMTLIALCLGVGAIAPGIAVVLVILSVPALVRTSGILHRRQRAGQPPTLETKLRLFLASFGIVTAIGAASAIGFFAVCLGGGFGVMALGDTAGAGLDVIPLAFLTGIGGGLAAGILVLVWLSRKLWPTREAAGTDSHPPHAP